MAQSPFEASHQDPRLLGAIRTPSIQEPAAELVRLAVRALTEMRHLDENLYAGFVSAQHTSPGEEHAAESLRRLWKETFGGLAELLDFCRRLSSVGGEPDGDTSPPPNDGMDDFDLVETTGTRTRTSGTLDLGAADLGSVLEEIDSLGASSGPSEKERWARVLEHVAAVEYGLRSLIADAEKRLEVALGAGKVRQALGILDETQGSASEGVHALVTAVYAAFVPEADPARLVPGYLTSLGRALLVRRGVAELARRIEPLNDVLQGPDASKHQAALEQVRAVMRQFVGSHVCRAMRAADRWQMEQLEQQIAALELPEARKTSEGIAKYLESLASINEREVLIVHDRRKIEEMREQLASARQLFDLSPAAAAEMMERAHEAAIALRGRSRSVDLLLDELEALVPREPPRPASAAWLELLERVLATASG